MTAERPRQRDEGAGRGGAADGSDSTETGALFGVRRTAYGVEIEHPTASLSVSPTVARDRGVAVVEAASDDQGRAVVDQAIRVHAQSGRPFSVNDFRDLLPAERANLLGARVLAAAKRREIVRVGYEPATHAAGHGRPIALWQAPEGGAR